MAGLRKAIKFQSTLSVRRATEALLPILTQVAAFQSTLSVRRATARQGAGVMSSAFQSTLSVRRATILFHRRITHVIISIHALREESD